MVMATEIPRRLAEGRQTSENLSAELYTVLGVSTRVIQSDARCDSITINVTTDSSGRAAIEIVANRDMSALEAKGFLHDALFALARVGTFVASG